MNKDIEHFLDEMIADAQIYGCSEAAFEYRQKCCAATESFPLRLVKFRNLQSWQVHGDNTFEWVGISGDALINKLSEIKPFAFQKMG